MKLNHLCLIAMFISLALLGCKDNKGNDPGQTEQASPLSWAEASELNNRAIVHMDQDEVGKAIKLFEELVKRTDGLFVPRFNLAIGFLNAQNVDREAREAEMERSESLLREVMAEFPDRVEAPYSLAVLLEHRGRDQDEIEKLYARALELAPSHPECLYRMGKFYFQKRPPELDKAEALLRRALELEGHFASAWNTLFGTYHRLKKADQAKTAMESFSLYSDSLPEQGKKLSLVYNFMGEFGCCIRELDMTPPQKNDPVAEIRFSPPVAGLTIRSHKDGGLEVSPALADIDNDGTFELFHRGRLYAVAQEKIQDVTSAWKLSAPAGCIGGVFADLDHDKDLDLIAYGSFGIRTFLQDQGTLNTAEILPTEGATPVTSVQIADLDHDGDLDIITTHAIYSNLRPTIYEDENTERAAFKKIPWQQIDKQGGIFEHLLLADMDRDGDLDIVRSSESHDAVLLLNNRLWNFRRLDEVPLTGARGALTVADIDQDGKLDLLAAGSDQAKVPAQVLINNLPAAFKPSIGFGGSRRLAPGDLDNNGRPDLIAMSADGSVSAIPNHGSGKSKGLVLNSKSNVAIPVDIDSDGRLDLLLIDDSKGQLNWTRNTTLKAGHFLKVRLQGKRANSNASVWSNHFGIGAAIEVAAGGRRFFADCMAKNGNAPTLGSLTHIGIGSSKKADSIRLLWPDFVLQNEEGGEADGVVAYEEVNRKASSCPVLFKYSGEGEHFDFVTDFLGVGGLGFFLEPGQYAPADHTETVRIGDLPEKDGKLELRVTEPMEEISYFDQLRLVVVDHPEKTEVQADERLSTTEELPTGAPLLFGRSYLPESAVTRDGTDCLQAVSLEDRIYQGGMKLDRRFIGYLEEEQWLSLRFPFAGIMKERPSPAARLTLFIDGWVEYPYSHVNYAAWESGVRGQSFSLDAGSDGKAWRNKLKEVGYPGGMTRCMSMDITDAVTKKDAWIRLRTNLEVHVDRVRLAWVTEPSSERVTTLAFDRADLRFSGYPAEVSPDGRMPKIYDYQNRSKTFDWKRMAGRFTSYGDVRDLLSEADNRLVVMNHGEEIALSADASKLPPLPDGWKRTYFLQAVGWCKDMDPYTAFPDTVAPMPSPKESYFPGRRKPEHTDIGSERRLSGTFR